MSDSDHKVSIESKTTRSFAHLDISLARLSQLIEKHSMPALRLQLEACRRLASAGSGLDVAVVGRFKAGKSSFLNSLAQRSILPVGVTPATAVVTRLRFSANEKVTVRFLYDASKQVALENVRLFVDEQENPSNEKRVAAVEIELPSLEPYAPLQFVDTPGLGSALTQNTETALNWLPNVGAVLVATSTDAPLAEQDLSLIQQLLWFTPKVAVLLTKVDLLTELERGEVRAFVERQLQKRLGIQPPVFLYSVKPAHTDLKLTLEQNLLAPLIRDRTETTDQILRHKIVSLVAQASDYLQIALAAATQAEAAQRGLREKLHEERLQFSSIRDELRLLAREYREQTLPSLLDSLKPGQRSLQTKLATAFEAGFGDSRASLPALSHAFVEWLSETLTKELTELSHSQRAMFTEPFRQARKQFARVVEAFQYRVAQHVQAALGLQLAPRRFQPELQEPGAPPVDIGSVWDTPLDIVGSLVPMVIFRHLIKRHLAKRLNYEVEKNLSRLAAQWSDRVVAAIDGTASEAEQYAEAELATLEQMLSQTQSTEPELREAIDELNRMQDQPRAV